MPKKKRKPRYTDKPSRKLWYQFQSRDAGGGLTGRKIAKRKYIGKYKS